MYFVDLSICLAILPQSISIPLLKFSSCVSPRQYPLGTPSRNRNKCNANRTPRNFYQVQLTVGSHLKYGIQNLASFVRIRPNFARRRLLSRFVHWKEFDEVYKRREIIFGNRMELCERERCLKSGSRNVPLVKVFPISFAFKWDAERVAFMRLKGA